MSSSAQLSRDASSDSLSRIAQRRRKGPPPKRGYPWGKLGHYIYCALSYIFLLSPMIVVIGASEPVFDPGILESKELARQGHEIVSLRSSGESAMPSEVSTLIEGLVSFEVLDRIYLQPAAVNIDGLDWAMLID